MAALFALHDWTPPSATELRTLLLTLLRQTRRTSQVLVDVAEHPRRTRTYKRDSALVEAAVKTGLFVIGAYADPTDDYRTTLVS